MQMTHKFTYNVTIAIMQSQKLTGRIIQVNVSAMMQKVALMLMNTAFYSPFTMQYELCTQYHDIQKIRKKNLY